MSAARARPWAGGHGVALLVLGCLLLAVLAHTLPAGPTYDPWAWISWGREITEWNLDTRTGPSWKPLPVLFTTPFALAGDDAAPELWLVIAQAGGLLAFAFTYRLAARLAGWPAGLIAAAGLVLADEFIRNFARGNSEGLLVGVCLWAIERHLDGHRRQAFLLGVAAGLLRPELWPFLLLYGIWLMWTDPPTRLLVVGCGLLTLVLWFVPEYLGSGDFFRAASRAREPNPDSAAFADIPFVETFRRSASVLMVPLLLGAVIALVRARLERDRLRLLLGAIATALMVAVAAMTQAGFAGNLRYVALPAALVCVLAGAGWVDLVRDAAARYGRAWAGALAAVLLAAAAPFAAADVDKLGYDLDVVRAESQLYDRLPAIVAKSGGAAALLRCGPVYAPPFEVQAVAWAMHVHSWQVGIFASPPGTVLAGHFSALGHDPRFPEINKNRRWFVGRNCRGGTP
ncbi:MAG TPA: hypothetical protein VK631_00720 [Solirubrobacteraceae bacterium]|nr:hypothetical protein [Solirubrobacteraceae bacterium]